MSIPVSLGINLKTFQQHTCQYRRLFPDRTNGILPGSTSVFKLPSTGVIDLNSISLAYQFSVTNNGAATLSNIQSPQWNIGMIRRLDVICGGASLGLSGLNDVGFAATQIFNHALTAESTSYRQSTGLEGLVGVPNVAANTTESVPCTIKELIGFLGAGDGLRYLPLSLLPAIEIHITWHAVPMWTNGADLTASTIVSQINNLRLLYNAMEFEDNLVDSLWNARVMKSPLRLPVQNMLYFESPAFTTAQNLVATVSSGSVDYIIMGCRPDGYATTLGQTRYSTAGGSSSTFLLTVGGQPQTGWNVNAHEILSITENSLERSKNPYYAPSIGDYAVYLASRFAYIHRFAFPTDPVQDGVAWQTGLNSYGQVLPFECDFAGGDTTNKRLYMLFVLTSVLELSPGRQVVFLQ